MAAEPVILHVCPHCSRVFETPSVCAESGRETKPTPMVVPPKTLARLLDGEQGR